MSVDEAEAIGLQQILLTTELELTFINGQIIMVRKQQAESLNRILKDNPEDYLDTKATYELIIQSLKADRDRLMLEYDKYNQVIEAVDSYYSELESNKPLPLKLEHLFNEWECEIAKRYVQEKYVQEKYN